MHSSFLAVCLETRKDISNIAVVSEEDKGIINDGNDVLNVNIPLYSVDWYGKVRDKGGTWLTSSHVQNVIKDNYKWVITGEPRTRRTAGYGETVGVFID